MKTALLALDDEIVDHLKAKDFICQDRDRLSGVLYMRVQLIVLVLAFLIVPAISQYTQVGGSYGMTWLNQTGNLQPASQAAGLWSWGTIPKGHSLSGGKLTTDVGGVLIYPAFSANDTPIVLNAMTPGRGINASNLSTLSDPNLYEDPWTVAQMNDRPVLFRVSPY